MQQRGGGEFSLSLNSFGVTGRKSISNILTRQKWHVRQHNIKVNDIVIKHYNLPRNQWHLARVSETFQKSHGLIHRVKIQVGEQKPYQKQDFPSKPSGY